MDRRERVAPLALALVAGGVVLLATRSDPVLSADSITYLSAAERLHEFDGYRDFTGDPLTHFPPVFPVLLAVGGRSLQWAAFVGAAGAATVAALLVRVLSSRVRWSLAVIGALVYAVSQAVVRTESTVWSETPYAAFALATFFVLRSDDITIRRSAVGGLLAGLGFLTRYAGAGLVLSGLVMVVVAARSGGRPVSRCATAYLAVSGSLAGTWMMRNLVVTGEPLGPHFRGGADDSARSLVEQMERAFGRLVLDLDHVGGWTNPIGGVVLVCLLGASTLVAVRRPRHVLDVGMATFATTSVLLPLVSRVIAGTHIEARIMSPVLIPFVYFLVVAIEIGLGAATGHRHLRLAVLTIASLAAVASIGVGLRASWNGPDRVAWSAADPQQFSPALYALVADLPDDAAVVTNNPWRVWWQTGRDPTRFAFTLPTAGNSHFPLTADELARQACASDTYLAWFPGLLNAGGNAPTDVRPDLATVVRLEGVAAVDGGELARIVPANPAACAREQN